VRNHAPVAHRVAYLITRSTADADDALQEGTVRAWRAIGRFDPERSFRPWFTTLVANSARNVARTGSRREALRLRVPADTPPRGPEESAVSSEAAAALAAALDALPDRYRQAVALRHVIGLSERETAAALGIRPGTVKSRVARGIALLRDSLGEEWR
jgi:RNA polymerase sigma-70 factor (ECF subfamily)